jgi:signal transduction histidine kinase
MKLFENKVFFRYLFISVAIMIALGSLLVSHYLVKDLAKEEESKIRIWTEATKEAASVDSTYNMHLILEILESNKTIPVILFDKKENFYTSANIDLPAENEQGFLKKKAISFEKSHTPIITEAEGFDLYVYYDDSYTLKRLQLYPYIQLGILTIFLLISFFALMSTKKMEQDRVWVGLSKETAHQLGTPISSLMAWIEYLRMKDVDPSILSDMERDTNRLQVIIERFSKIGSVPELQKKDISQVLTQTIAYLEKRISTKVLFVTNIEQSPLYADISEPLFGWVIENLSKNAVDAMSGQGRITFTLSAKDNTIILDIQDTGKGIAKSKFREVFSPGYTTKTRGWGLGLSLAKRIIESYHKGKIYVKESEPNVGTTFRIELRKNL